MFLSNSITSLITLIYNLFNTVGGFFVKNLSIDICCGARCTMMGAIDLLEKAESFKSVFPDDNIAIQAVTCDQSCKGDKIPIAPVVIIDGQRINKATPQKLMEKMMEVLK